MSLKSLLKRTAIAVASVILLLLIAAGAGVAWLLNTDLRPFLERKATEAIGRPVTVAAVSIGWGDPLALEIRGLKIANAPWGSGGPDMVAIAHVQALIDVAPLLKGVIQYRMLSTEQPVIVLERDENGVGNWKFGDPSSGGGPHMPGGLAVVPKDRTQFPTLLDFALKDGNIRYRTSSGRWLEIALGSVAIRSDNEDTPVTVDVTGSYNKLPATLKATTGSFTKMRDADVPLDVTFKLINDDGTIDFQGTMMNPLDFDGVAGAMTIAMQRFGTLLKALDAGLPADFPATLSGDFTHNGDEWKLDKVKGNLAKNPFTGSLALKEGPRGGTDKLAIQMAFPTLKLDTLLPKRDESASEGDIRKMKLSLPAKTAPEVRADLTATRLEYRKTRLDKFAFAGTVAPGRIRVDRVKFAMAGGIFQAKARAEGTGDATHLQLEAGLPGADLGKLLTTLDLATDQIGGEVSLRAVLEGTGGTLGEVLGHSNGAAVIAMVGGKVARSLLEKASGDLRSLFRKGEGMAQVKCLLGVATIKDGIAKIVPLTLRTSEASLHGGGTVDLRKQTLDLGFKADPKSTGFFALDIPIRIAGAFDALKAGPAGKSDPPPPEPSGQIPESVRAVAEASGCMK